MREAAHHAPLLPRHIAAWLARPRRQVGRAIIHDAVGDHALETHDEHVGVVEGARPGKISVVVLALHRGHEGL